MTLNCSLGCMRQLTKTVSDYPIEDIESESKLQCYQECQETTRLSLTIGANQEVHPGFGTGSHTMYSPA